MHIKSLYPILQEAVCIGCGCSDSAACATGNGEFCHWLVVERHKGQGVCSNCPSYLTQWQQDRNDGSNSLPSLQPRPRTSWKQ